MSAPLAQLVRASIASMGGPRFKSLSVQNFDICIHFNSKALPSTFSLEAHTLVVTETKDYSILTSSTPTWLSGEFLIYT